MPTYETEGYQWKGFTNYDEPVDITFSDDDDQLDWYGQDTGDSETAEIDGTHANVHFTGTIVTEFTDSDGETHEEEFAFTYTSSGYFFIPPPGSEFDEGSTITSFPENQWEDTDGVDYDQVLCFTPGCRILTDQGWRDASQLHAGDRVQTADNGLQPLVWTGHSPTPLFGPQAEAMRPVRIRMGSFGRGVPARDITLSPQHRIVLSGTEATFGEPEAFATAKSLVDGHRVTQPKALEAPDYCHLMLEHHEVLFCEGLPTESFQPGPQSLPFMSATARRELIETMGSTPVHMRAARPTLKAWEVKMLLQDAHSLCA